MQLRDVAHADAGGFAYKLSAVFRVQGVHLKLRETHEEARAVEAVLVLGVIADDVADVLAEEALDALAKLLASLDVFLVHTVEAVGVRGAWLEGGDLLRGLVVEGDVGDEVLTSGTGRRLLAGLPRARDEPGPFGVVKLNVTQARCVQARLQVTGRECVETGQPAASGGADSGGSSFSATKCGNRKAARWLEDAADLAQGTGHVREQVQGAATVDNVEVLGREGKIQRGAMNPQDVLYLLLMSAAAGVTKHREREVKAHD